MSYLLTILSPNYDLLSKVSCANSSKEDLTMLLVAFASSDLLPFLKHENYYFSIDKQYCWNVSVLFTKIGYILVFVHTHNETKKFLEIIDQKLGQMVLNPYFDLENIESIVKNAHSTIY